MSRKSAAELEARAQRAKSAAAESAKAILHDAELFADPRTWIRSHPWLAITSALIGGFTAAAALTPAKLKSVSNSAPVAEPPSPHNATKSRLNDIVELLWKELLAIAENALGIFIASYIRKTGDEPAQDGPQNNPDGPQ